MNNQESWSWTKKALVFVVAFVLALGAFALVNRAAQAATDDCEDGVSTAEWSHIQDLGDEIHSFRRSVIEDTWKVSPVGYRNEYFRPKSVQYYSYAYNFCQNSDVKIVIVYRRTSGAWQYAIKGEFI